MEADRQAGDLLSAALLEQVQALADAERRPVRDMVREAVEDYLRDRRAAGDASGPLQPRLTPQEAVARILELRKGNALPEGMTIRDMQTFGRA